MTANNVASSFSILGFLVREGTALVFAGRIWYAIWGGFSLALDTPDQAF